MTAAQWDYGKQQHFDSPESNDSPVDSPVPVTYSPPEYTHPRSPTPPADWDPEGAEQEDKNRMRQSPSSPPRGGYPQHDLRAIMRNARLSKNEPGGHGILLTYLDIPFNLY